MLIIFRQRRRRIVKRHVNPKYSSGHRKLSHAGSMESEPNVVQSETSALNTLPPNRGPLVQLPAEMNPYLDFLQRLPEFLTDMPAEAFKTTDQIAYTEQRAKENVSSEGHSASELVTMGDEKWVEGGRRHAGLKKQPAKASANESVGRLEHDKCSLPGLFSPEQTESKYGIAGTRSLADDDQLSPQHLPATALMDGQNSHVGLSQGKSESASVFPVTLEMEYRGICRVQRRATAIQGPHLRLLLNIRSCLHASKTP
ncbi:MAG: hypothetical protein CENE_01198 [Candidatus Celerinatantimonas neptuna]|nr:MAG: hypothetical protein CENE_01198 [Candidatus Celerinatantimonas neptuna]